MTKMCTALQTEFSFFINLLLKYQGQSCKKMWTFFYVKFDIKNIIVSNRFKVIRKIIVPGEMSFIVSTINPIKKIVKMKTL
jgi:hypothetical protein